MARVNEGDHGWPEWTPGIRGPVPVGVVEALARGDMRFDENGFIVPVAVSEPLPTDEVDRLIRGTTDAELDEIGAMLDSVERIAADVLPEPLAGAFRYYFKRLREGRYPGSVGEQVAARLVLLVRELARRFSLAPVKRALWRPSGRVLGKGGRELPDWRVIVRSGERRVIRAVAGAFGGLPGGEFFRAPAGVPKTEAELKAER